MTDTHSGFVSLIGAPNAGKSTLINKLVGSKISIVTHKAQTTRNRIIGIVMRENTQIILVDTPGLFKPDRRLEKAMVDAAWQGAADADIVCLVVDAARRSPGADTIAAIERLKQQKRRAFLILNKVDITEKPRLLDMAMSLNELGDFEETFMISAKSGSGTEDLLTFLSHNLPKGPFYYDPESITDMPMRLFAAEITREKLFLQLQDEIPYSVTVETESFEEFKNGDIKIAQVIYTLRDTQKAIILGKGGNRIKYIGRDARAELSELFDTKVHLNLFVKTRKNWVENPERYLEWGLDFDQK